MNPLSVLAVTVALSAPLPTWTQKPWLEDGVARVACAADGALVVERHGRLVRLAPDGVEQALDALGHVAELRPLVDGFWLQRRGTTESAVGQRLDGLLRPVGEPFEVPEPAFDMRPCGPDAVVGRGRKTPLKVFARGSVRLEVPSKDRWGAFVCDPTGATVYHTDAGDLVARAVAGGAELWRVTPGTHPDLGTVRRMAVDGDALMVVLGNGRVEARDRATGARTAFAPLPGDGYGGQLLRRGDAWWLGQQRFSSALDFAGSTARGTACPVPGGRLRLRTDAGMVAEGPLDASLDPAAGIGHAQTPTAIAVDPKSGAIYSIDEHRTVIGWGTDRPRWVVRGLGRTLDKARDLALGPDGRHVYALGRGTLVKLSAADGTLVRRWALDAARGASRLRLSADARRAVFGDGAGGVGLIDLPAGDVRLIAIGRTSGGHDPHFDLSPDGKTIAVADPQHPIRLYDADTGALRAGPTLPPARMVAFDPSGTHLAATAAKWNDGLRILRLPAGEVVAEAPEHDAGWVSFDATGRTLAWGDWSHGLGTWCWRADCPADRRTPRPIDPPWHVSAVAFGPDGTLWSTGADQALTGWDPATGAKRRVLRAGRASQAHASAVTFTADALLFGLLDGSVLRIPLAGGPPTQLAPRSRVIDGMTYVPSEADVIQMRPDGAIEAAHEGGVIQRWVGGAAQVPIVLKTSGSPGRIAPFGTGWLHGAWGQMAAFDAQGRPTKAPSGIAGAEERMVGDGDRVLIETRDRGAPSRLWLVYRGRPVGAALTADEIGPIWLTPDGAAAMHRSYDRETADEEGDEVAPTWRLARFAAGTWTDDDDADVEMLPTLSGEPGLLLADGRLVVGTVDGIGVLDPRTGAWKAGFWLGPRGHRVVTLAGHPTRAWLAVGDDDGGVHVFDIDAGRRVLHAFGYADGDWVVRRADGTTQAPKGGRHR